MSTAMPVGITDAQLAVLLRQAQWALDDAAHDVPAGRATSLQRAELAGTLEALALLLRTPAPGPAGHPADEPGGVSGGVSAEERRGWCLAGCGCALEVPPTGRVFVDCAACAPNPTPTPADHRCSDPGTSAPGDRPVPAGCARPPSVEGGAARGESGW